MTYCAARPNAGESEPPERHVRRDRGHAHEGRGDLVFRAARRRRRGGRRRDARRSGRGGRDARRGRSFGLRARGRHLRVRVDAERDDEREPVDGDVAAIVLELALQHATFGVRRREPRAKSSGRRLGDVHLELRPRVREARERRPCAHARLEPRFARARARRFVANVERRLRAVGRRDGGERRDGERRRDDAHARHARSTRARARRHRAILRHGSNLSPR